MEAKTKKKPTFSTKLGDIIKNSEELKKIFNIKEDSNEVRSVQYKPSKTKG